MDTKTLHRRIKLYLWSIIIGLALSGITAFPLESELALLKAHLSPNSTMGHWINTIYQAIKTTNTQSPWLSYGTDWLAFAHLVIALVFIGPLRHPVRNIWVIQFGMIACIAIFPLAFIAGAIRDIPFFWRLIDCSFGVIGFVPLYFANKYTRTLEKVSLVS
ncbi:MAG: hypothetical protein ACHQHN_10590 [Sphingobacteriales bacterium]